MDPRDRIPWERFWRRRQDTASFEDGGFLADPKREGFFTQNEHLYTTAQIHSSSCVVLLGEPGLGKSTEMGAIFAQEHDPKTVNLSTVSDETVLYRKLFGAPWFRHWAESDDTQTLFLESLDEGLLRIPTLVSTLSEELRSCPTGRLRLRIACRAAVWPGELEELLRSIWSTESFGLYELLPLRRNDVALAALRQGIEPDAFLRQIVEREVVPFAAKPVTLRFLLNIASRGNGQIPLTQREIYEQGCRLLAEETRPFYATRDIVKTDAPRRLEIAAMIAAVLKFSGRAAVFVGSRASEAPDGAVAVEELCTADISHEDVRESLNTALFAGVGEDLLSFSHETYAEFLAARSVARSSVSASDRIRLLSTSGALVPQLAETAVWLAGDEPQVRDFLLKCAPTTLASSDVLRRDPSLRSAFIERIAADPLSAGDLTYSFSLARLAHPDLAAQLRPLLADGSVDHAVRKFSLVLAEDAECRELLPEFLAIARDPGEDIGLRWRACGAVRRLGDAVLRTELRPLAEGIAGDDPRDEIKSAALHAMWPGAVAASDFFALLPSPESPHFARRYSWFCSPQHGMEHLRTEELPSALRWLGEARCHDAALADAALAIREILQKGVEEIGTSEIKDLLTEALFAYRRRLKALLSPGDTGRGVFSRKPEPLLVSTAARRVLLTALLERHVIHAESTPDRLPMWQCDHPLLVTLDDADWIVERMESLQLGSTRRQIWCDLAYRIYGYGWEGDFTILVHACERHPDLAAKFHHVFDAVPIASPQADWMREQYRYTNGSGLRRGSGTAAQRDVVQDDDWNATLNELLDASESGQADAFLRINETLENLPSGEDEVTWSLAMGVSDIRQLPGWNVIHEQKRERVVSAAERYLRDYTPVLLPDADRVNSSDEPVYCGYRALRLLKEINVEALDTLPAAVWQRWAPTTLAVWTDCSVDEWSKHTSLLAYAYNRAPDPFTEMVIKQIEIVAETGRDNLDLERLEHCWDVRLLRRVGAKTGTPGLPVRTLCALLEAIFLHGDKSGNVRNEVLGKALSSGITRYNELELCQPTRLHDRLSLARIMCLAECPGFYSVLKPVVLRSQTFGRRLLQDIAHRDRHHLRSLSPLTEEELAELYDWLEGHYPSESDPQYEGAHSITARDDIAHYRDQVIAHLRDRATSGAVAALSRLEYSHPNVAWLSRARRGAEIAYRRVHWKPMQPSDVLSYLRSGNKPPIRSADDLQELLLRSLDQAEVRLRAETPMAYLLWEGDRPRGEEALSDFVADHIKMDLPGQGITVIREAEIRRRVGGTPGQNTDIHVTAIVRETGESVRCIIEVKGCWNTQWRTGMSGQLASRYLRDNDCRHGIFLIGWFEGRQEPRSSTRASVTEAVEQQAEELKREGVFIAPIVINASLT